MINLKQLSEKQRSAFFEASGQTVNPEDLGLSILSIFAFLLLLWLAWVIVSQFKLWQTARVSLQEVGTTVLRAAMLSTLIMIIVNWSK